jgi:hypothetical protein
VANRGWTRRPISISNVAQSLSLARPISLTTLIFKCLESRVVKLVLTRTTGIGYTHSGVLSGSTKVKKVRNLEQFRWHLSHTNNKTPPTWEGGYLERTGVSDRWNGMFIDGEWRGNYGLGEPKPWNLNAEIEI